MVLLYCITVLLYYCIAVLYYCITVLLYCITVLLYCITVLLYCCIVVLLYCCITVLLYCITVLLYCWCTQVSSWGGYVFLINLIPLHVLALMITGRFSHRIYVAYSTVSHPIDPLTSSLSTPIHVTLAFHRSTALAHCSPCRSRS